jgi:hypothetical protein
MNKGMVFIFREGSTKGAWARAQRSPLAPIARPRAGMGRILEVLHDYPSPDATTVPKRMPAPVRNPAAGADE